MIKTQITERIILWTSFIVALIIAISELLIALRTNSQAVFFDAMYDSIELIVVVFTLFLTPLFYKPFTEKHPFGFGQIESFFILIKAFMLLAVTVGLSLQTLESVFSGGNSIDETEVSFFQLIIGFVALIVFLILRHLNKKISSPIANIEILGWKMDIFSGFGMALAFYGASFLEKTPFNFLAPYFDPIITLFIVLFMIPSFIKMIFVSVKDVFLFAPEAEIVDTVKVIADETLSKFNFTPVFCDVTRTGRKLWVSIYFTVKNGILTINDLASATDCVNSELTKQFDDFHAELVVEPKGVSEHEQ